MCLYYISNNSLSPSMCVKTKQSPNPHQIPKVHLKSFPDKSNLKIKLMKCVNLVQLISHIYPTLLNLCHSLDNITHPTFWISSSKLLLQNKIKSLSHCVSHLWVDLLILNCWYPYLHFNLCFYGGFNYFTHLKHLNLRY